MNQKGFAPIIFILIILVASIGIAGGSLAIKKYYPNTIPNSSSSPTPSILKGDPEDVINKIHNSLSCHFNKNGRYPYAKYPSTISSIDDGCLIQNFGNTNSIFNYSLRYIVSADGLKYTLEVTFTPNDIYHLTNEKSEKIPLETIKQVRDGERISNLDELRQAIAIQEADNQQTLKINLCFGTSMPCSDNSLTGNSTPDGTGWVKIALTPVEQIGITKLPVDPFNNEKFHYVFCADKTGFEINAELESEKYSGRMKSDGGDDDTKYEVGTNLQLINNIPNCKY